MSVSSTPILMAHFLIRSLSDNHFFFTFSLQLSLDKAWCTLSKWQSGPPDLAHCNYFYSKRSSQVPCIVGHPQGPVTLLTNANVNQNANGVL